PDLLPDRAAVQTQLDDRWGVDTPTTSVSFDYSLLHPGLMRGVIARIGDHAGLDAIYWRGGVYVYETTTRSRALIEQEMPPDAWRGRVMLQTKGVRGPELSGCLAVWIEEENDRMGLRPEVKDRMLPVPGAIDPAGAAPLDFAAEPVTD